MKVTGILTSLCVLAVAVPATAQQPNEPTSFRGIAGRLNTTPEALESEWQAAHQADRKLTRGQFLLASVLAKNLAAKHPEITTRAILDDLKRGMSIGQALLSLGLSPAEAQEAERTAQREVREAERV